MMTYRELMEMVRKNPGCLQTEKQKEKYLEYKYGQWLQRKNQEK